MRVRLPAIAAALACGVLAAGCGWSESPAAAPAAGTRTSAVSTTARIWLTRSGLLHHVTREVGGPGARAALRSLLSGPTDTERTSGVRTAIPKGTRVLAVSVAGHTATVNLSERFAADAGDSRATVLRLAQVVYTLTALP